MDRLEASVICLNSICATKAIVRMKRRGVGVTEISRTVNTSTVNVYHILERVRDGDIILDELQIAS